jgi:3'-5' exoribonuclease
MNWMPLSGVSAIGAQGLAPRDFPGGNPGPVPTGPGREEIAPCVSRRLDGALPVRGRYGRTERGHYPLLDRDLLLAGALLHDLAKIEELEYSRPPFNYTDRGRLVGHLVLGVDLVRRAAEKVPALTADQVDQLVHIILSHHGQLAYGSPVLPMTPEAILLHHLDDMDAKMNYMEGLGRNMTGNDRQWTEYQRHLERYLYLRGEHGGDDGEAEREQPEDTEQESGRSAVREPGRTRPAVRQRSLF